MLSSVFWTAHKATQSSMQSRWAMHSNIIINPASPSFAVYGQYPVASLKTEEEVIPLSATWKIVAPCLSFSSSGGIPQPQACWPHPSKWVLYDSRSAPLVKSWMGTGTGSGADGGSGVVPGPGGGVGAGSEPCNMHKLLSSSHMIAGILFYNGRTPGS